MLLSQVQIKEEELKLLEISGFGLAQYCDPNSTSKIFKDLSVNTTSKQLERLKIVKIQSSGFSSNANIKAMVSILLKSIYNNEIKQDLLDFVKSSLYSPSLDLTEIKHCPLGLSNGQMKKLVVQFFYSLTYSQFNDRVDSKLAKYPIIMQIFVLYLRILLKQLGLHNAQNYLFRLPSQQVFGLITQYFDLNCKQQGRLYLFFEDRMFMLEDCHNEILLGQYIQNDNQIKTVYQEKKRIQNEDPQDNLEIQWSKQTTKSFNRSLQFRGIVSESVVFQHQTATPFFNFNQDSCSSFQSSKEQSQSGDSQFQRNSMIKVQRQASLLKQMDRMTGSQQMSLGGNLIMKRTFMENEFKVKNDSRQEGTFSYGYAFGMTLQSPITLDSPHILEIPADRNFGEQADHFQKLKEMKKSKSEKRSKPITEEKNQRSDPKKQQVSHSNTGFLINCSTIEPANQSCDCISIKKQKLKLNSQLYQVNVTLKAFVPDFSKKYPQAYQIPTLTPTFNKSNLVFTRVKSISGLEKTLKEKFNSNANSSISYNKQQNGKIFTSLLNDQSFSTCSIRAAINPESDTHSRREFSPLSNIERPLSPFGGSKSIKAVSSPKITFNYKNPLKYSVCIKKYLQKAGDKR